jgi:hypothetical protein
VVFRGIAVDITLALVDDVLIPLTLIGVAAAMLGLARMALGDYRRLFRKDPARVMSAEVIITILSELGGPGYLAAALAFGGVWMLAVGVSMGAHVCYDLLFR